MAMDVLREKLQITTARQELIEKGASFIDSPMQSLMRRLGLIRGVSVGDKVKSWDVLSTLKFIESNVQKSEPILDIGCYASEIVVALHKIGYSEITGVDLNQNIQLMPYSNSIHYKVANFLKSGLSSDSFGVITSISVIEHGYRAAPLLAEMSRLLKPGGYFIASFDYWPEKIDTTGIKFFGMDWKIFSKEDVNELLTQASKFGLYPVGELINNAKERVISCGGQKYTFGWLALRKSLE